MAKGSQLSQLKSALTQAGVTGQQQSGAKKRKRTSQDNLKDKDKKAAKLKEIHARLNPFDVKVTKLKHEVGGRKLKGVVGRPAQSKQAGLEQRKKTLLKEYEDKDRSGGIVDRRFGENDPTMSLEERMLERFTKERQRASRGAAFNLEEEDELTHYGQSLSKLDDFDNAGLGLDDDEEEERSGQIDADVVRHTHFGGFDDDDEEEEGPARKKSKAEVMAEVMAKSKEHRLRRQMEREQEDNVRHELDEEFDSLRSLIFAADPSLSGTNREPLGRDRLQTYVPPAILPESSFATYDQQVRELAFEQRSKPKDRTKTEEEIALVEKEALEKAERKRRKRMLGLDDDIDSEEDQLKSRNKRKRGADDLEDDFEEPEEDLDDIGTGLGDNAENKSQDDSDEEESDEEESDEQGSDDDNDSGPSEAEGEHEELVSTKKTLPSAVKELPFTFPCPGNHEEFLAIVNNVEDKDVPTVIQRIRTLHHTSLAEDNKLKLQVLSTILIDHILYVASPPTPRFNTLSLILPHLTALTRAYPIASADHFVSKLTLMHKNLKRGLSRGSLDPESKTWPGLAELAVLRVIGSLWPTSDMNHAVITPTRLLLGSYLGLARVRSLKDVASGLFLCTLFLQFEQLSKRLVPEAVNFMINAILHLAPSSYATISDVPGSFPSPDFRSDLCTPLLADSKKARKLTSRAPDLVNIIANDMDDLQTKLDVLGLALELASRFAEMYKSLDGFIELFEPILDIIQHLDPSKLPENIKTRISSLIDVLSRLLKFSKQARKPLLLQAHKPIPIPSYIPKFDSSSSSYLRRQDPDHERNEASKLKNQYKQERKGAIRELRKDSRFLAGVEQQKQKEKDQAYRDSMRRVYGSIEGERAEEKAMDREKAREKKRAGRK